MTPARRNLLVAALAAGFAALGGWVALRRYMPEDTGADAASLLFALSLPDHAGRPFALSSLRGQVVVLNFWATWCAPCVEEMPELAELHEEIAPRRATVLGLGVDSATNVAVFAARTPFPYPLLVAGLEGIELAKKFGNRIGGLPFTVIVDRDGRVASRTTGRIRLAEIRERVRALL